MQGPKTQKPHEQSVKAPVHHNRTVHNFRVHSGDSVHFGQKNISQNISCDFAFSRARLEVLRDLGRCLPVRPPTSSPKRNPSSVAKAS